MESRHSNGFDTWQLSSQSSEIPSSSGLNRNWYQSVWFLENEFHIFEFQQTLCSSYLNMPEHTHAHIHTHFVSYPQNQTYLCSQALSWLQILSSILTNTQRKWPSLERQQVILKELTLCMRPRHQPLISQINYRIATRRHLSAARKWKQKSAPEANSKEKKKKEGKIDGEASQCKQNMSPHSFDYLTPKNNKPN